MDLKGEVNPVSNVTAFSLERHQRIKDLCEKIERLRVNQGFTKDDLFDSIGTILCNWEFKDIKDAFLHKKNINELAKLADQQVIEMAKADPEQVRRIMRDAGIQKKP